MPDVRLALIGAAIVFTGPLFLTLVFVAAILDHAIVARDTALAALGVTYLSYVVQWPPAAARAIVMFLVALSIILGAAAGLLLLIGM
jgi:hypothetical protein